MVHSLTLALPDDITAALQEANTCGNLTEITDSTGSSPQYLWMHPTLGLAGWGQTWRISTSKPAQEQSPEAGSESSTQQTPELEAATAATQEIQVDPTIAHGAAAWAVLVAHSQVIDRVNRPGTGLCAFASFGFSPDTLPVLVVPEFIIGVDAHSAWMTHTALAGSETELEARLEQEIEELRRQLTVGSADSADAATSVDAADTSDTPRLALSARPMSAGGITLRDSWSNSDAFAPGFTEELHRHLDVQVVGLNDSQWEASVRNLARRLRRGQAEKVVLARAMDATFKASKKNISEGDTSKDVPRAQFEASTIAHYLAQNAQDSWIYAVDGLVGATPEMLVEISSGVVKCRVLAGTGDPAHPQELMRSEKDLREHVIAVESVTSALTYCCTDITASPSPEILPQPTLAHLASSVSALPEKGASVLKVAAALHPTAAVCGRPTTTAAEIIQQAETEGRGRYAGPVGWVDALGEGQLGLALRCGQIDSEDSGTIRVYAGAGIMPQSRPRLERAEIQAKMAPVFEALVACAQELYSEAESREGGARVDNGAVGTRAHMDKDPKEVASMFDQVAKKYDRMNDLGSLYQTRQWRRAVKSAIAPVAGMKVLDVAAGTGTSTAILAQDGAEVIGVDLSEGMIQVGRERHPNLTLLQADACDLPFGDDEFDAVTISFGIRNVQERELALAEFLRVTKPGGRLVICEFSTPTFAPLRWAYHKWLRIVMPRMAAVASSDSSAYEYLIESILEWPAQTAFGRELLAAGWQDVAYRNLTGGIVALHRATKPWTIDDAVDADVPVADAIDETASTEEPAEESDSK